MPWRHCWPRVHTVPHAPQLFGSNCVDVHPEGHSIAPNPQVHAPAVHCARFGHIVPHAPQLLRSVIVFAQVVPHIIVPVGQAATQLPALQN